MPPPTSAAAATTPETPQTPPPASTAATAAAPAATSPAPSPQTPPAETKREFGPARRLVTFAVVGAILAALSFYALPMIQVRAILVPVLSAVSGLAAVGLAAVLLVRFFRGQRRRSWGVAMAVVLAVEALLVGGLNTYADSKTASVTTMVQAYQAEVGAAVSHGNEIAAGHAPSGVTFATVQTQAQNAYSGLDALDTPGELLDYAQQVKAWAADVANAAKLAQTSIAAWKGVPATPSPFLLTMTVDQANAAFATSAAQIATLIEFGDRAFAAKNAEGLLWVAARLDAQDYWLEGVYTSADSNWIEANLRFIEPFMPSAAGASITDVAPSTAPTPGATLAVAPMAESGMDMQLVGARTVAPPLSSSPSRSWRAPRAGSAFPKCMGFLPCGFPQKHKLLRRLSGAIPIPYTATAVPEQWTGAKQEISVMDPGTGVPTGGAGLQVDPSGAPKRFSDECTQAGGTVASTTARPLSTAIRERLPTTEAGWSCMSVSNNCWSTLTYSGSESKGGGSGCPELNLVPPRYGPVVAWVAGVGGQLFPASGGGNAPGGNLPAGFPTNLPAGTYQIQICVTSAGYKMPCTVVPGTYSDAAALAAALAKIDPCKTGGYSSCTPSYTAWNGTYFDWAVTYKECMSGTCAVGTVRFRVTKVG
jgi:hypothetical protein